MGLPRSVCSSSVTLGQCFTPDTIRVNTTAKSRTVVWCQSLFWACLNVSNERNSQRWQVVDDGASNTLSLALPIATCSPESLCLTQNLPAFIPASHQSLPHSSMGRVLSSHSPGRSEFHRYEHTVVKDHYKLDLCRSSPVYSIRFRANGSHTSYQPDERALSVCESA